jgi:hypothetical protein
VERSTECLLEDLHHHLVRLRPQSLRDQEEEQEDIAGETGFVWNTCCESSSDSRNPTLMTTDAVNQLYVPTLDGRQILLPFHHKMMVTALLQFSFFQDQVRLHDEINKKYPLPNNQACNFLQAAVSGTPNLASVYQTWNINNRSGTDPSEQELQFSEYVQLLILNAQVHDAGKKNCPKTPKIDVNLTDLAFEDIEDR